MSCTCTLASRHSPPKSSEHANSEATLLSLLTERVDESLGQIGTELDLSVKEQNALKFEVKNELLRQGPRWVHGLVLGCLLGTHLRDRVYAYIRRQVHCAETAEDLTQQTVVNALKALRSGNRLPGRLTAWLRMIAKNAIRDRARRRQRQRECTLEGMIEAKQTQNEGLAAIEADGLRDTLSLLERRGRPEFAELLKLRLDGWDNAAVAQRKEVPVRTIERWWQQIRAILKVPPA